MKVYTHDYTKAVEANSLLGEAYRCAISQEDPPCPELRDLLEKAMDDLDSYLAEDNICEEDSEVVYIGFVKFNDIEQHLIKRP